MTEENVPDPTWQRALLVSLAEAIWEADPGTFNAPIVKQVLASSMAAVLPHMETAYRTGRMAGASDSAARLAQKNLALAAEVTELRCLNVELKKDLAAQRLLTAIEKSNRTAPTEAMVLAKELAKTLREVPERATKAIWALKSPEPSGSEHYRSGWADGLEAAIDALRAILAGES